MMRRVPIWLIAFTVLALLSACVVPPPQAGSTGAAQPSGKLMVFGAYATAIEEPWDGVIHTALQ